MPDAPAFETLTEAALDRAIVSGWTHNFYRYPARFSPRFASAVIGAFSKPGDVVLDPYMGGGTAIVEAMVAGRRVVGNDLNSLAAFVAKVKVTALTPDEILAIQQWTDVEVPQFGYRVSTGAIDDVAGVGKMKNLSLSRARFIKKATAVALASVPSLATRNSQRFARCILLRVGQWALDGRSRHTSLTDFREKLGEMAHEMLDASAAFSARVHESGGRASIYNRDARHLASLSVFREQKVDLVITSPPYPGVHVLYHRWQVDGRRETPAPYWITGCNDGKGASFYNFGDRREAAADDYFRSSLETLRAIRRVVRDDAMMVQLVAFNQPDGQLVRYLDNMQLAGFAEVSNVGEGRIWRDVPNRKWHAHLRGQTHGAREVILVHRAVGEPPTVQLPSA